MSAAATDWRRLDRRMLVVHPVVDLVKLVPVLLVIAITGGSADDRWRLWGGLALAVAVLVYGVSRWFTTTYRVGVDRVELRTGLLRRHHRSVHRDRIRTADLTANPAHRLFGLAVVRVGTGRREGGDDAELTLDAVRRGEAERLRALLLGGDEVGTGTDEPPELARLRWTWVRFAPLTFSALAVVGAVWVGLFRLAEEFSLWPDAETVEETAGQAPIWLGAAALLVTAVVGAAVVFVEGWWGYRLTRAEDGGLVLRRGLLTRRTLSLEGRRLRGVELDEPLLVRLGRGARPLALTTGLRADGQGEHVGALGPAMPRREAHRVAAGVLGVPDDEGTRAPLQRHPRAAVLRRLIRGFGPAAVVAAVLLALPEAPADGVVVPILLVGAALLALDRIRSLGHALTREHLVARQGAWVRRTVVLRRGGVIGWRLTQSLTQRRAGLVTLHAVTAAGRGRYEVLDVGVDRALELVGDVTPGLLDPFLVDGRGAGRLVRR
ncbi:PH domain-containing protein [Actinomycetospora cinnamomea]|uniref:Putative membrane protein n=1 Tax=Actinomycetospora cinnamomea TaxID=663609 RepID=A0A2U1F7U3_9PSEU|nr:PH domain-containing protein [Actinomycetospora cinnamomea]PVZ08251.1 putative membrane protein [Actinomycetospora cinnamomea]